LPPVSPRSDWNDGCVQHARYMVKNDVIGHSQDPANPWYTAAGDAAARNSNVMVHSGMTATDVMALQMWMTGPFHGIGMIDPALTQTGFGSYREAIGLWRMGACLDVLRGLGSIPGGVQFPLRWPENGQFHPFLAYTGNEYPDPLSSCPHYTPPSGAPIYLQIGSGNLNPVVTAHSLTRNGQPVEACVYTESTYMHRDSSAQSLGRAVLNMRDAIVMMPRQPLQTGAVYQVSITVNGQTHTWSFRTANGHTLSMRAGADMWRLGGEE